MRVGWHAFYYLKTIHTSTATFSITGPRSVRVYVPIPMYSCVLRINYTNLDIRILHTLMYQIDLCYTDSVFDIRDGMRRLSGIFIVLAFFILSKLILFSHTSNKNLVNVIASRLFPFLITLIFTFKFIFIDIFQMCGHFIIDAFIICDLEPFGITGNVWRGSPQKIIILLPKNVLFLSCSSSFGRLQECCVSVRLTLHPI